MECMIRLMVQQIGAGRSAITSGRNSNSDTAVSERRGGGFAMKAGEAAAIIASTYIVAVTVGSGTGHCRRVYRCVREHGSELTMYAYACNLSSPLTHVCAVISLCFFLSVSLFLSLSLSFSLFLFLFLSREKRGLETETDAH